MHVLYACALCKCSMQVLYACALCICSMHALYACAAFSFLLGMGSAHLCLLAGPFSGDGLSTGVATRELASSTPFVPRSAGPLRKDGLSTFVRLPQKLTLNTSDSRSTQRLNEWHKMKGEQEQCT